MNTGSLHTVAESYLQRGWRPVAIRARDKRPLHKNWQEGTPPDRFPVGANIGIVTGRASGGLVVLDFDAPQDFERVLGMTPLEAARGTPVVRTARGFHVYAHAPAFGRSRSIQGILVRGDGGLVVAPPSVHASGVTYTWVAPPPPVLAPLADILRNGFPPEEPEAGPPIYSNTAAPRPAAGTDKLVPALGALSVLDALRLVLATAPAFRERVQPLFEPPHPGFDRSRAEFLLCCFLTEKGHTEKALANLLLHLPGGKARERDEAYAVATARRACAAHKERTQNRGRR